MIDPGNMTPAWPAAGITAPANPQDEAETIEDAASEAKAHKRPKDRELESIRRIMDILDSLPQVGGGQARVLSYVNSRLGLQVVSMHLDAKP